MSPPNTTLHNNYTLQTRYMSQISQLSKLAISVTVSNTSLLLSLIRRRPSHIFLFLNNQTCCLDTFVTKARFNRFFLHQTQSKRDSNVREKARRTLLTMSPALDMTTHPSTQEVGRGVGLAASYTRTSTDSDSSLYPDLLGPEQTRAGLV